MDISENICPVCKNKNELETIVCLYCGAMLGDRFMDPGTKTKKTDIPDLAPEKIRDWSFNETAVPYGGIAVFVEGEFTPAYIDSNGEFVIGRTEGTPSEILLDLSPLGGYAMGLSRRHAVIRRTGNGYEMFDLGSVNGTWLDDERLVPHKPYPLPSGSHLRLGRMRLFVFYHPFAEVKQKP